MSPLFASGWKRITDFDVQAWEDLTIMPIKRAN